MHCSATSARCCAKRAMTLARTSRRCLRALGERGDSLPAPAIALDDLRAVGTGRSSPLRIFSRGDSTRAPARPGAPFPGAGADSIHAFATRLPRLVATSTCSRGKREPPTPNEPEGGGRRAATSRSRRSGESVDISVSRTRRMCAIVGVVWCASFSQWINPRRASVVTAAPRPPAPPAVTPLRPAARRRLTSASAFAASAHQRGGVLRRSTASRTRRTERRTRAGPSPADSGRGMDRDVNPVSAKAPWMTGRASVAMRSKSMARRSDRGGSTRYSKRRALPTPH